MSMDMGSCPACPPWLPRLPLACPVLPTCIFCLSCLSCLSCLHYQMLQFHPCQTAQRGCMSHCTALLLLHLLACCLAVLLRCYCSVRCSCSSHGKLKSQAAMPHCPALLLNCFEAELHVDVYRQELVYIYIYIYMYVYVYIYIYIYI